MSDINITTSEAQPLYFTIQGIFQAGLDGTDGKTVLNGSGVPSDGVGSDGDFYINTDTYEIYLKASGTWGSPTSLIGADGDPGLNGSDGADGKSVLNGSGVPANGLGTDGDFYIDTSTYEIYLKTAGVWGSPVSLVGADGADGQGVAIGGTTGQVLAKASNTDFDTEWVDQSGGGGSVGSFEVSTSFEFTTYSDFTSRIAGIVASAGLLSATATGGAITITTAGDVAGYWLLRSRPLGVLNGWNLFDNNPFLGATFRPNNNGNTSSHIGILLSTHFDKYSLQLSNNYKYAGFIQKGGVMYTVSNDGTGEEATDVSASWANNTEHIAYTECSATNVKFYIDGTLVATHSTKVPTGADDSSYQITMTADNNGEAVIAQSYFYSYSIGVKMNS